MILDMGYTKPIINEGFGIFLSFLHGILLRFYYSGYIAISNICFSTCKCLCLKKSVWLYYLQEVYPKM